MDALNAVGLTPLSVLAKRNKPRKNLSLASFPPLKNQSLVVSLSRNLQGELVLLSSVLGSGFAKALTFDGALQLSVTSGDFDPSKVFDSVINFVVKNPIVIGGGAVTLAVPLLVAQLLSEPKPWGVESAKNAYKKLADDSNAQLLDIRAPGELRQVGSPDVRGLKKRSVAVAYKGEDKPGFLKKLALKFKEPENTTLFILDK